MHVQSRHARRGRLVLTKTMVKLWIQSKIPDQTATATSMVNMVKTVEAEGREMPATVHKIKSLTMEK
jgi:hypothetical protein